MKHYTLKMNKDEAHALIDIYIKGMGFLRSTPAEMSIVEKLTNLGLQLEDAK